MKIEFNNKSSKEYIDEVFYVATYASKFRRRPDRRVYQLTKYYTFYLIFSIIYLFILGMLYLTYKESIFVSAFVIFFFLLLLVILLLIKNNKRIKYFLNNEITKTIEFNKDTIKYIDKHKTLTIEWSNIKKILINKYSIIFLPDNNMLPFISVDVKYLNKIMEAIKKYDKEKLVINKNK